MSRRRPSPCWTSWKTPASSCWSTCARSLPRGGRDFRKTSWRQASTRAASPTCIWGGLGTPKEGREAARSGKFDLLHKIYAKHLKTSQAKEELDELSALVKKSGPVCILCYERDHTQCHRQWIAEIIEERDGAKVVNLAGRQV